MKIESAARKCVLDWRSLYETSEPHGHFIEGYFMSFPLLALSSKASEWPTMDEFKAAVRDAAFKEEMSE